jgi:DNA-directed RNA polymerase specialized sigma24 family protein
MIRSIDRMPDGLEDGRTHRQIALNKPPTVRTEDRARLWNMLRDLPPRQGTALLLSVAFQLPRRTVAAVLDAPQPSVSRLCNRALRMVRARATVTGADWR